MVTGSQVSVKWSVPNYSPQVLSFDNSLIALFSDGQTSATFNSNGNIIGLYQAIANSFDWVGSGYFLPSNGIVASSAGTPTHYAPTYAAIAGGNESGNETSILEVLSPINGSSFQTAQNLRAWA